MRIGVINWDCSLPPDTFFGGYFSKSLSGKKWRTRVPYYADILSDDTVCCHYRTAEEFDIELQYAIDAKIDYFAYVWHTDDKTAKQDDSIKTSVTWPHAWTQDYARKLHQKSALSTKIKLCAILMNGHPFTESDYAALADAMKQPYYEKIKNRPIVYLFGGYATEIISILRHFPEKYKTENPYIIFMNNGVKSLDGDYSKADAVSSYNTGNEKMNILRYEQHFENQINGNEHRKKYGLPIIPTLTVGWNPTPRIESPIPWYSYEQLTYCERASAQELEESAIKLSQWIQQNKNFANVGHILAFAWNEFEEGGYICPTYNVDGTVNEDYIFAFAKAVDIFNNADK